MNEQIADAVIGLSYDGLSEAAQERLTLCLLANLTVGVAGVSSCVLPRPVRRGGIYTLLSGESADEARQAAFWNAAAMHARTQDDFHPVGNLHIGTVVIPALLAVAQEQAMTGSDFLDALAAGYMVATGMSRSASPKTTPRGVRSTGVYAPFGATAAVGRARGLGREHLASALGLTTAFAAGTTQAWLDGSDEWQVHPALAAEAGLRATELAAAGVRGGEHAIDGKAGLFRALLLDPVGWETLRDDFDPSAAIEESVIKRYPVSGICQSVVLAAERVSARLGDPDAVKCVLVEMNAFEITYPGTLNMGPAFRSFGDRLMSAAFCTAALLSRGALVFADFHGEACPARDRLLKVIEVRKDDRLKLLSSRITVEKVNGERIVEEVANSREQVRIDWSTIGEWGSALWEEAGRPAQAYEAFMTTIRGLPEAGNVSPADWLKAA